MPAISAPITKEIAYRSPAADGTQTVRATNYAWNDAVARQYAANHLSGVLGHFDFDVADIEIVDTTEVWGR